MGASSTPKSPTRIFLIATEESGDRLGASLMVSLRQQRTDRVDFVGVGGPSMTREGLSSLFPIDQLAIMGFAAVAKQLPMILRLIRQTADAVVQANPDCLVIIDSPDFTHRVARRARAKLPSLRVVNYVAPTVWAWREGRARKMRRYVDRVLALLPFEPEAYRRLQGPPCTYVGHPLIEKLKLLRPGPEEAARRAAAPPILLVLLGSRRAEIRHLAPVFGATIDRLRGHGFPFDLVLPTTPHLETIVRDTTADWTVKPRVVVGESEKHAAFRIAHAALAKSGTVTLELAISGVPMVTGYRGGAIEAWIARRMVSASSVILANLVLGKNVVPEFLQNDCVPDMLIPALRDVMIDTPIRRQQIEAFAGIDAIMSTGHQPPSVQAADVILAEIEGTQRAG